MNMKAYAAEALLSHCGDHEEMNILMAWLEFDLSEELPTTTKLNLKFGKRWAKEGSPGRKVQDFVRIVTSDNDVSRSDLSEELRHLIRSTKTPSQK